MGALEIWITPAKGSSSSRMRKIAPETEKAAISSAAITVALRGANRPKLAKSATSHDTRTTRNTPEMRAVSCCATSNNRARQVTRDRQCLGLQRALRFGGRRERQGLSVEGLAAGRRLSLARGGLTRRIGRPQPRDRGADGASENRARFLRLRAVLRKRGVEQGKVGCDLVETVFLSVVGALGGSDQQAENQRRHGRDEPVPKRTTSLDSSLR
jgi:hypothetical protein